MFHQKKKGRLEEPSKRDILTEYFGGKHLLQMVCSMCPQEINGRLWGEREPSSCAKCMGNQNHWLCGAETGFWMRRNWRKCEAREKNGSVGVVVLAFDVDLSLGCPMSPFAQAVRRR